MSLSEPPEEHLRLVELEAAVLADVEAYGRCPLADKPRVAKLSAGIQDRLGRIRALTRDLELAAEEAEGEEEEQRALAALLAQHKAEYARIQAAFRQAAVDQRTAALKSAAEERRELLAGGEAGLRQRRAQTEADAAALAEDVTGGLRRTRQVLAEELEHTSATLAAMEASHAQLGKTRDEYHGQHRHLRKSKGLLGTLDWQAKSETYMLWFGLTLFLAVCAYIFQKRAGHFVPNALKPTTLLAGRQPVPAPATLRRSPAAPLHKAGSHRQPVSVTHQPPHMPRHQHRRPPASPAPATQQQGEAQLEGGDEAVWPSGSPEPGTDQQSQQQVPSQQQPPQQAGQGVPLHPPPAPLDQPPLQPQLQASEQPVQPEPAEEQQKPADRQQPDLLEPIPAEPEGQPGQAGGEAQPTPSEGGAQVPAEAEQQQAPEEQQAAGEGQAAAEQQVPEQQAGSGAAADAEVHPSPEGAGQQRASEADLAEAAAEAAAAVLPDEAAALEQAAADAAAAATLEVAAGEAAASQAAEDAAAAGMEAEGQAAGEQPPAVGPEGAPEPDRHIIVDRQGRRIAVDPTAEFVRSPLGGQPTGEPAGQEAPRDEL